MFSIFWQRKSAIHSYTHFRKLYNPNLVTEATFHWFSTKLVFLKIYKTDRKTCSWVSFLLKLQSCSLGVGGEGAGEGGGVEAATLSKKRCRQNLQHFWEYIFKEHFWVTVSIVIAWNPKSLSFLFFLLTFAMLIYWF